LKVQDNIHAIKEGGKAKRELRVDPPTDVFIPLALDSERLALYFRSNLRRAPSSCFHPPSMLFCLLLVLLPDDMMFFTTSPASVPSNETRYSQKTELERWKKYVDTCSRVFSFPHFMVVLPFLFLLVNTVD
jgi:hypothetical protein